MTESECLSKFFFEHNCPGIAKLVEFLAKSIASGDPCLEIGSSSWVDNERVLDEITLAMRKYGFPHIPASHVRCDCGEHHEWHKHLYVGGRISPLDWLTLFSHHAGSISPKALDLFDKGCGGFADIFSSDGGTEITDI
jgi:hypothetical protein